MGRVVVDVIVENFSDVERADRGEIEPAAIRRTTVSALVDSGATFLCLPRPAIESLGLSFLMHKRSKTVTGEIDLGIYAAARVTVQDRACVTQIMELPDDRQPLLGQIPLEMMDWWIDPTNQRLVGNPEHGGQWLAEVF